DVGLPPLHGHADFHCQPVSASSRLSSAHETHLLRVFKDRTIDIEAEGKCRDGTRVTACPPFHEETEFRILVLHPRRRVYGGRTTTKQKTARSIDWLLRWPIVVGPSPT